MGPAMGKIKVKEGYGNRTGNKHSAINLEILTRDQKAVIKSSTEVPQYWGAAKEGLKMLMKPRSHAEPEQEQNF